MAINLYEFGCECEATDFLPQQRSFGEWTLAFSPALDLSLGLEKRKAANKGAVAEAPNHQNEHSILYPLLFTLFSLLIKPWCLCRAPHIEWGLELVPVWIRSVGMANNSWEFGCEFGATVYFPKQWSFGKWTLAFSWALDLSLGLENEERPTIRRLLRHQTTKMNIQYYILSFLLSSPSS